MKAFWSVLTGLAPGASSALSVGVLAFFLGGAAGGWAGWKITSNSHKAAKLESVERAVAQAQKIAKEDAEVAAGYERVRERVRTVYRDREVEVVDAIPLDCRRCGLTPQGLDLLNGAVTGGLFKRPPSVPLAPASPAQPDHGIPGPDAPPLGDFSGGGRPVGGVLRQVL